MTKTSKEWFDLIISGKLRFQDLEDCGVCNIEDLKPYIWSKSSNGILAWLEDDLSKPISSKNAVGIAVRIACSEGKRELLEYLIAKGADLNSFVDSSDLDKVMHDRSERFKTESITRLISLGVIISSSLEQSILPIYSNTPNLITPKGLFDSFNYLAYVAIGGEDTFCKKFQTVVKVLKTLYSLDIEKLPDSTKNLLSEAEEFVCNNFDTYSEKLLSDTQSSYFKVDALNIYLKELSEFIKIPKLKEKSKVTAEKILNEFSYNIVRSANLILKEDGRIKDGYDQACRNFFQKAFFKGFDQSIKEWDSLGKILTTLELSSEHLPAVDKVQKFLKIYKSDIIPQAMVKAISQTDLQISEPGVKIDEDVTFQDIASGIDSIKPEMTRELLNFFTPEEVNIIDGMVDRYVCINLIDQSIENVGT